MKVPVSILKGLPGMSNEQQNVRHSDLKAIMKIMRDTGKLPLGRDGTEYAPFINVAYNGEAWVNEGNHRIMAADRLGWDTLPVDIRYFDGGERIEHGDMYPGKIGLGSVDESQQLDEGASSVLYHQTTAGSALKILQSGSFQLSSVTGTESEKAYAKEGYPYFFSTTRTRVGDYHRWVSNGSVMFVLDGNWFGSRYPVKPMDYWERAWLHAPDRSRESEDRVLSKKPSIPIDGVEQVHVFLSEHQEYRSPQVRQLMIIAKRRGIEAFLYTDEQAWRLLDTRRAVPIEKNLEILRGPEQIRPQGEPFDYLTPWLELLYKKRVDDLSEKAKKIRYNLIYYGDSDQGLGTEMANARKPGNSGHETVIKLNNIMHKHNFKTTLDLARAVKEKWTKISDEDKRNRT